MRKSYFLLLITLFIGVATKAQDTISCSLNLDDTLKYVISKTSYDYTNANSSMTLTSIKNNNDGGGQYGYTRYGQYYEAPNPVKISGAKFYGIIYSGSADSIWVKLYNMNAGMPDTVIDSVYAPLDYQPGFTGTQFYYNIQNVAIFPNQPVVTSDYMIALENRTSRDYYITRTIDGYGNGEGLSYTYYEGLTDPTYDGWYNLSSFGAGWDFDYMIEPIVEYGATAEVILNTDTLCYGDSLSVAMSIAMNDTAIFTNKFYSKYPGFTPALYDILPYVDYGEGNGFDSVMYHTYAASGNYTTQFEFLGVYPFWSSPAAVLSCTYNVHQTPDMNQVAVSDTLCLNQTAVLYPGVFDSYQWSSGQLTDSIQIGTFLQADSLYFSVMVTKGNCSGQYGYPVIVDNCLGIEENEITFEVYPNPANTEITINGNFGAGATLKMTNLLGEVVYSNTMYSNLQSIDVSRLPAGFYTLNLMSDDRNLTKKIQIVR